MTSLPKSCAELGLLKGSLWKKKRRRCKGRAFFVAVEELVYPSCPLGSNRAGG